MKRLSILGSTGSIGRQTLEVVSAFPEEFSVEALAAGHNLDVLKAQILDYKPKLVSVLTSDAAEEIQAFANREGISLHVENGQHGLETVATIDADLLVVAVVGTAGLMPTYKAIEKGIPIGLACKEVLVSAGELIMPFAMSKGVPILPMDSEHAALKQCLAGVNEDKAQLRRLVLTASGGPFWQHDELDFADISPQMALKHPNWTMGRKITIDSATLMNKGLEVIEAHHLFQVPYDQLDVVIHPTSIVHSMVEFADGTFLAQLGNPDMRYPIQYVLTYPEKWDAPWPQMSLMDVQRLEFHPVPISKFPLFSLAYETGDAGGSAPAVMNAANEVAVQLFLDGKIGFTDIYKVVKSEVDAYSHHRFSTIDDVEALDHDIKSRVLAHT